MQSRSNALCPNCKKKIRTSQKLRGKKVRCRECETFLRCCPNCLGLAENGSVLCIDCGYHFKAKKVISPETGAVAKKKRPKPEVKENVTVTCPLCTEPFFLSELRPKEFVECPNCERSFIPSAKALTPPSLSRLSKFTFWAFAGYAVFHFLGTVASMILAMIAHLPGMVVLFVFFSGIFHCTLLITSGGYAAEQVEEGKRKGAWVILGVGTWLALGATYSFFQAKNLPVRAEFWQSTSFSVILVLSLFGPVLLAFGPLFFLVFRSWKDFE